MEQFHTDFSTSMLGNRCFIDPLDSEICTTCRYRYGCYSVYDVCECPPDPLTRCVACLVTIQGSPVATKPSESTYIITIWDFTAVKSKCTMSDIADHDYVVQFALTATISSEDMEHMYSDIVKKYGKQLCRIVESSYGFKAPVSRGSYLKDFISRIQMLLSSEDRQSSTMCAHVKRRTKGYSHAT